MPAKFDVVLPDGFSFDLPVWTMVRKDQVVTVGAAAGAVGPIHKKYGPMFLLFTNEDDANDLIAIRPDRDDLKPYPITSICELAQTVEDIAKREWIRLVFDPSNPAKRRGIKSRAYDPRWLGPVLRNLDRSGGN
jgi:hypothetical protein